MLSATYRHAFNRSLFCIVVCVMIALLYLTCTNNRNLNEAKGPSPERSPAEELTTFQLPPGLKMQLVAAEPMVQDPVVITFDENGRLWVVEMRGFMPDINGKGEKEPVGRVSVLEDTNQDGKMDRSKIYIDGLILPRAIALVPAGALIAENGALWLTQDLDGDLHADTKTLIDSTYAGGPTPEHSGNGLLRNLDNWYYNAKSRFRYRLINGKWQRDSTEFRGQWGISHDDEGRLYYNYNWSQLHADLVPPNYLSRNKNHRPTTGIDHGLTLDRRVYPIRPNPAVNRGYIPGTLDKEGRLLEFTAACSPFFYRGNALPHTYYGNVFVCEPSGNLIKRDIVEKKGLELTAYDPTPGKEFLASTDERFRPVYLTTAPDGALYIADMYRGLIQHGSYVTPYLREQTIKRNLVQPINRGRIWRIVPADWKQPRLQKLSGSSLQDVVNTLSHDNGWYRDMAQRLLVERGDTNICAQLTDLVLKVNNQRARFNALWTMDGLNIITPQLLVPLLSDPDLLVRITAVRLLEPFAKKNKNIREQFGEEILRIWVNAPVEQVLQISLAASVLDREMSHDLLAAIAERYDTSALVRDALMSSLPDQEFVFLRKLWNSSSWRVYSPAKEIFLEMLTTAIVRKRDPAELASLLTMLNVSASVGWKEKAVLTGIAIQGRNANTKPVHLASAPKIMARREIKSSQGHFHALMAMFEWPGHVADTVKAETKHPLNDNDQKQFVLGRQLYLSTCAACHGTAGDGLSRFAPPLIGSDWVLGNEKRLVLLVLHGMEGPVEVDAKHYDAPDILPVMPAHSTLDDASISAILTYIRNEWGNAAGAISARKVSTTRNTSQGRVMPWTAAELNKLMLKPESDDR